MMHGVAKWDGAACDTCCLCVCLHLIGMMTIGMAGTGEHDFVVLREVHDQLVCALPADGVRGEDE